ncbi:hypothetical protein PILCRDRAFT_14550 [Piloderma croceum F 1598]|uniref:Uncharacterized protein n=1 Tax=Piloderma croceum (strain F 1598) TaxID=765440 RepID=A0A0C3AK79_PILCF|nr:hypothetical protein PILCRDRAFT_14550 [Piloderma croceum F 1598]
MSHLSETCRITSNNYIAPQSPDIESSFETTIVSSLAVYTKGLGKKPKEVKTVKFKEFDFTISNDNYLDFLCELLQSQSQDKYQVAAKKCYGFKYLYPPLKVLHNAVDVDNKKDYKWMVTNVLEQQLKKIKTLVDMKDQCHGDDDSGSDDNAGNDEQALYNADGISDLDQWAHALYDRVEIATILQPPNTLTFEPLKHLSSINSFGHPPIPGITAPQGSELSAVASILSDVCGLMGLSGTSVTNASVSSAPNRLHTAIVTSPRSPVRNTPTQLTCFLHDCKDNLGITNATQYESPLYRKLYGLDILHRVADSDLESIGIPTGDIICLKDASGPWYNGPSAKHHRVEVKVKKHKETVVSYEKRWFDADGIQTGALLIRTCSLFLRVMKF